MPCRAGERLDWAGACALGLRCSLEGEKCCLLPLSAFEVNVREEWRVFYLRNGCERG